MKTVIFFITCTVNIIKQFLLHLYFCSDCPRNITYCYEGKKSLFSFTISGFYIFLWIIYIYISLRRALYLQYTQFSFLNSTKFYLSIYLPIYLREGTSNPLQYSCPRSTMDRGSWQVYSPWDHKKIRRDLVSKKQQYRQGNC